jgi:hypothetical protein
VNQDIRNLDHQGFSDSLPLFRVPLDDLLELSVLFLALIGESSYLVSPYEGLTKYPGWHDFLSFESRVVE